VEIETPVVVHEMTMHSLEESNNSPQNMPTSSIAKIIDNIKEYGNALDDGPNNPPLLEIAGCNNEAMIPPNLGDAWLPKILITIGKETHHAMLDLGSSVSALSKEFYELL